MSPDETKINTSAFSEETKAGESESATTIISGHHQPTEAEKKKNLRNVGIKAGLGILGVAGGALIAQSLMSMAPSDPEAKDDDDYEKPDVKAEFHEFKGVDDKMSFDDAFKAARSAEGPNGMFNFHGKIFSTLFKEEEDKLSSEEKKELNDHLNQKYGEAHPEIKTAGADSAAVASSAQPVAEHATVTNHPAAETETHAPVEHHHLDGPVIVIHDEAPVASNSSDEMSFKDAFAVAREEVGPGGVFEWHGHYYNTYTSNEYGTMSAGQKHSFVASLNDLQLTEHHISHNDVDVIKIDQTGQDHVMPIDDRKAHNDDQQTDHNKPDADNKHDSDMHLVKSEVVHDEMGNKVTIDHFVQNGEEVIKIHPEDHSYDFELVKHADGSAHMHDYVTGLDQNLNANEYNHFLHPDDNNDQDNGDDDSQPDTDDGSSPAPDNHEQQGGGHTPPNAFTDDFTSNTHSANHSDIGADHLHDQHDGNLASNDGHLSIDEHTISNNIASNDGHLDQQISDPHTAGGEVLADNLHTGSDDGNVSLAGAHPADDGSKGPSFEQYHDGTFDPHSNLLADNHSIHDIHDVPPPADNHHDFDPNANMSDFGM